jgi:hypothetical protein
LGAVDPGGQLQAMPKVKVSSDRDWSTPHRLGAILVENGLDWMALATKSTAVGELSPDLFRLTARNVTLLLQPLVLLAVLGPSAFSVDRSALRG